MEFAGSMLAFPGTVEAGRDAFGIRIPFQHRVEARSRLVERGDPRLDLRHL